MDYLVWQHDIYHEAEAWDNKSINIPLLDVLYRE